MAQINIPEGYAELTFNWAGPGFGSDPVNVLGIAVNPEGTGDLLPSITAMADALCGAVADSWDLPTVTVRIGATGGPPYASYEASVGASGSMSGTAAPPNVTTLIRKNTFTPGRPGRGRIYLPGPPEGDIDAAGNITGTLATNLPVVASDLLNIVGETEEVLFYVILHPVGSPLADTPSAVTQLAAQTRVATQRRRLRN